MVILVVQLWELCTQRLHQGLSETILVNTLTDIKELKKIAHWTDEFSTDALGEMLSIICNCRSSKK